MGGVLPIDFVMDPTYLRIRYLELTTRHESLLAQRDCNTRAGVPSVEGYRFGVVAGFLQRYNQ